MNALPSFEPPVQQRQPRRTNRLQQSQPLERVLAVTPQPRPVRSKLVYVHRRQGLEVIIKLVTYSSLSIFGIATLANSIGYNWAQHSKLQHLATELQDTRVRTAKVNRNFTHSFDPQSEQSVMAENSYKVAPDRLQIVIANPTTTPAAPKTPRK